MINKKENNKNYFGEKMKTYLTIATKGIMWFGIIYAKVFVSIGNLLASIG